jgi:hypothetical protein
VPLPPFDPRRAVAIILGARVFPKSPGLEVHGTRFSNSAFAFRKYLENVLGIPRRFILDLFDDNRSPSEILNDISADLARHLTEMRSNNTPVQDLFFYYVGHGFLEGKNISDLCLAIRATDVDNLEITTLEMRRLAWVIRSRAGFQRRYLILDCCYGAAASRAWSQSAGPAQLAMRSTLSLFPNESPTQGTALLCAAESNKEANALGKRGLTTFSDALLECLEGGRSELGARVSLNSLHAMILEYLRDNYRDTDRFVRPKVESPEASEGDVALFPVFPNPLFGRSDNVGLSRDEAEQQDEMQQQMEAAKREQERLKREADQREQERLKKEADQREQERLKEEADQREQERLKEEADQREQGRLKEEADQREQERLKREADQREQERLKKEADQRERERLKKEADQRERERLKEEADQRKQQQRDQAALDRQLADQLYQKLMRELSNGEIKTMAPGLRAIIKLNPEHARAHRELANELLLVGRWDEALAEAKLAMRLGPTDEAALRLHGKILAAIGKRSAGQEIEHEQGRKRATEKPEGKEKAEAEQRYQVEAAYFEAKAFVEKRQWLKAHKLLNRLNRLQPGYRDVESLLIHIEGRVTVIQLAIGGGIIAVIVSLISLIYMYR